MNDIQDLNLNCTAFDGVTQVASGTIEHVAGRVKELVDKKQQAQILVFNDSTAEPVELDLRGTVDAVLSRIEQAKRGASQPEGAEARLAGPGRPKLGVIAREVTLLPRHWQWLNNQPGGCSVALRKLVEEARHANAEKDSLRQAQDATYRFMSAMAGNEAYFEEATRALFAGNESRFEEMIIDWPPDVAAYARRLAMPVFLGANAACQKT